MAVVWTSSGKKTTTSKAVGTAPEKLGLNVFWDPVAENKDAPDQSDVTANGWPAGTIVYKTTQ